MGPPADPPNWLRLNGGTGVGLGALATSKKLRPSSLLLRRNSNNEPCREFVPDCVTTPTWPPARCPYSAESVLGVTLNSRTASMPSSCPLMPPGVELDALVP